MRSVGEFDHLFETHQRRLRGFIRCRVDSNSVADDLVQETWTEVWRRIDTFDETRGTFWTFSLIWAKFVLKRHWERLRSDPQPSADETIRERIAAPDVEGDPALPHSGRLTPEECLNRSRALVELLRRVLGCSRPPHEIIAFGFAKLKWKPAEMVAELSHTKLSDLAIRLRQDYTAIVPSSAVRVAFDPLFDRLSSPLGDLIRDPRTRHGYEKLLARICGETSFADYYPDDRAAESAIVHWWDFVKRSVFTEIRSSGSSQLQEWVLQGYSA